MSVGYKRRYTSGYSTHHPAQPLSTSGILPNSHFIFISTLLPTPNHIQDAVLEDRLYRHPVRTLVLGLAIASPVARSTETDVKAIITSLKTTIAPNIANISEL
jgi:hypothetical protein